MNISYMCDTGNLKETLHLMKITMSNGGLELDVQGEIIKGPFLTLYTIFPLDTEDYIKYAINCQASRESYFYFKLIMSQIARFLFDVIFELVI